MKDTILHEIAHALNYLALLEARKDDLWIDTKHYRGHGAMWKKMARQVGCNPSPYYSNEVQKPRKQIDKEYRRKLDRIIWINRHYLSKGIPY